MGHAVISLEVLSIFTIHTTVLVVFLILANLSRIFGAARKKKPLYRWYYHAMMLVIGALGISIAGLDLPAFRIYALGLDIAGLLMGAGITFFYWEWLPRELRKEKR